MLKQLYKEGTLSKKTQVILFIIIALLMIFEGFSFWKVHILLWENSHVMSGLLQTDWFFVSNNRYGMYLTQLLPVLGAKLHLSGKFIILLQSLNYVLLPLFLIYWVMFRWKDPAHAIYIFFVMGLGAFYIHFAKEYALVYSLVFSLVLASYLKHRFEPDKLQHYLVLGCFLALIQYTFTLALFFIIPLFFAEWKRLGHKVMVFAGGVIVLVFAVTFIQSNYIMNNVAQVGGGNFTSRGVAAVFSGAKIYITYFAFLALIVSFVLYLYKRQEGKKMWYIWGIHLVFILVALRYLIAVCGQAFQFDITPLIMIRIEVTFFIIVASLIYFNLNGIKWTPVILLLLFSLGAARYVYLHAYGFNVNRTIAQKEAFFTRITETHPDKRIFIISRSCPYMMEGYELDDFKHESYLISVYLDEPKIMYFTNHLDQYENSGRPVYVNKAYDAPVDFYDEKTYEWRFDPQLEYPKLGFTKEDIVHIACENEN